MSVPEYNINDIIRNAVGDKPVMGNTFHVLFFTIYNLQFTIYNKFIFCA